jgi:hypothetical protein
MLLEGEEERRGEREEGGEEKERNGVFLNLFDFILFFMLYSIYLIIIYIF